MIRVTTYFKKQWSVTMLDTVAACPIGMWHYSLNHLTQYLQGSSILVLESHCFHSLLPIKWPPKGLFIFTWKSVLALNSAGEWTTMEEPWSIAYLAGGLSFTDEEITWNFPRINPLMSSIETSLLGLFMGIDGKQIDSAQMTARGYILTIVEDQVVMKIPMGGPDGYYKVWILALIWQL